MNEPFSVCPIAPPTEHKAAEELLPLVYEALEKLASRRLSREKPGQTLQTADLVHEAYVRITKSADGRYWDNQRHFFAAAAVAMRRILVERARSKSAVKHGGQWNKLALEQIESKWCADQPFDIIDLDCALKELAKLDEQAAKLVELRYFAGLTHVESAEILGISRRSADRLWAVARAWLYQRLHYERN